MLDSITIDGIKINYIRLPDGYFYKGKFYTKSKCFSALKKDGLVRVHDFYNGRWYYNDTVYGSLKELYEWNEYDFTSYKELKQHYKDYGIKHDPINCTMYSYDGDEENTLCETKEGVLVEISSDYEGIIEDSYDREERYLESLPSEKDSIPYFKSTIEERISILESFK